jgi:trk system potassium uptake protein
MEEPKMAALNEFVVIGLGTFGSALATELYNRGHIVLGVDNIESVVNEHQDLLTEVIQADATSEAALREAGVNNYDCCIVAIGHHIEDNILVTQTVLDLGIKKVWSRAGTLRHSRILEKLGVERVIDPELEAAHRAARILSSRSVLDFIEFAPGFSLAQVRVGPAFSGKTLGEIDFRKQYSATVVAIHRGNQNIPVASPEDKIQEGDVLFIAGRTSDIGNLDKI